MSQRTRTITAEQHNAYNREWKRRNRERYLENKRAWNSANRDRVRVSRRKSDRKYAKANRLKENCRRAIARAIATGLLFRPKRCSLCNADRRIVAHHQDYNEPLAVIWICHPCHRDIHHPMAKGEHGQH